MRVRGEPLLVVCPRRRCRLASDKGLLVGRSSRHVGGGIASLKERLTAKVDGVRERRAFVDHVFTMFTHYGKVNGNAQAAAATYFGFLSFFPILALTFFVIGYISRVFPDAQAQLVDALDQALPGVVGDDEGEIPMSTFEHHATSIGLIGLAALVYTGLGWLSGMRDALEVMFAVPREDQPNFFAGKARDLLALALIGCILMVSVGLTAALSGFSQETLGVMGLDGSQFAAVVLWVVTHGLAIGATTVLLVAMFKLLAHPDVALTALVQGALLGGVGFELLKSLANSLIGNLQSQPAFRAFGVALILLLWINYFSRLVMAGAAWAYTSPDGLGQDERVIRE